MALATQAHLEKFLQIDVTNEPDAAVTMLLENATGLIHSYIDRYLPVTSYSVTFDPPATPYLYLRQWPINQDSNAVTVTENGTALTISDDFKVYEPEGLIVRVSASGRPRRWVNGGLQSVAVTYDGGYDFTTDPLIEPEAVTARDICTRIAARVFQSAAAYANAPASAGAIKSVRLEGSDSVTYGDAVSNGVTLAAVQLTDSDKVALDSLRRRVLIS